MPKRGGKRAAELRRERTLRREDRGEAQKAQFAEAKVYARPRVATFNRELVEKTKRYREFSQSFKIPFSATAEIIDVFGEKHLQGFENIIKLERLFKYKDMSNQLIEAARKRSVEDIATEATNLMEQIRRHSQKHITYFGSHPFLPAWQKATLAYLKEIGTHPKELINLVSAIEAARKQAQ